MGNSHDKPLAANSLQQNPFRHFHVIHSSEVIPAIISGSINSNEIPPTRLMQGEHCSEDPPDKCVQPDWTVSVPAIWLDQYCCREPVPMKSLQAFQLSSLEVKLCNHIYLEICFQEGISCFVTAILLHVNQSNDNPPISLHCSVLSSSVPSVLSQCPFSSRMSLIAWMHILHYWTLWSSNKSTAFCGSLWNYGLILSQKLGLPLWHFHHISLHPSVLSSDFM